MKKVLLTTVPREALIVEDGVGGHWYDRTDTYMAWTCALEIEDRLSVSCPPIGLRFLKANVPDVEILEYPTWQEYLDALGTEKWDMVGISFYTCTTPAAIEMARVAGEMGISEIWGGNYGAMEPGLDPYFTRLIKGPGEFPLHQYVYDRTLERVHHPALVGESSFRGISSGVGYLYSKRGCNMGCHFCSTPLFNPMEDPIAMDQLIKVMDVYRSREVAHVIIYDETFFLDNVLADRVVEELTKRNLAWICLTRADQIRGRVAELTDRRMDGAIIGVESFRNRNLADVKKREDVYNVCDTIRELNSHGRRVLGTFMIGFEQDTAETIEIDIKQLAEEGLFACQLTILTPYYGTRLYSRMKHLINEPDLNKFDLYNLVWKHPTINAGEMREILAWAQRTVNDPGRIYRKIKQDLKKALRKKLLSRKNTAE
jgi:radical SAM superfamily enzyme YgiQ (UPF0313 family)